MNAEENPHWIVFRVYGEHDNRESHNKENDGEHGLELLALPLHDLLLLGLDNILALAHWHNLDYRFIGVLRVRVGDDILHLSPGEIVNHGTGQHGLSSARLANQ